MALDALALGNAIDVGVKAAAAVPLTDPKAMWMAVALAIVQHFEANAIVLPTTAGVPTMLSAAPGSPVTGVGSIK